jgi:hypothetical protein
MKRPPLSEEEQRMFDASVGIFWEWSQQPRSRERTGAQRAIGDLWNRLGWTMRGLDALEQMAKRR